MLTGFPLGTLHVFSRLVCEDKAHEEIVSVGNLRHGLQYTTNFDAFSSSAVR